MNVELDAALAAHRFGLGEPDLAVVGNDPRAWLIKQIGPADPQRGKALATSLEALKNRPDFIRRGSRMGGAADDAMALQQRAQERADMHKDKVNSKKDPELAASKADKYAAKEAERDIASADVHARLWTAATTTRPFAERLAMFWSNHFTVAQPSGKSRGLVGAFEREAIRPHIGGRFVDLLRASTLHPAMLRYLDNQNSVGANSAVVGHKVTGNKGRPATGLNENLAREVLELHTLGAESSRHPASPAEGYTQADVTEFARVLTGWTTPDSMDATTAMMFDPRRHDPGPKTVLGKRYPEGPEALDQVLAALAQHAATARFLATKLARHFVADEPPPALVDRLAQAFRRSDGDLPTVYRELVNAPEAWQPALKKLKTPEEFAVSSARLLKLDDDWLSRQRDGGIAVMGQKLQNAPSPAGWGDQAEDWLGPEAVWKRVEWVHHLIRRHAGDVDARALAKRSLGPLLSDESGTQLARAADGTQALSLLLLSPEFQRR